MISEPCQFGVVFGGQRFIMFAMEDGLRGGRAIHRLRCSEVMGTSSSDNNHPDLTQVTIAALLGPKEAAVRSLGMHVGSSVSNRKREPRRSERFKRSESASQSSKEMRKEGISTAGTAVSNAKAISVCDPWYHC